MIKNTTSINRRNNKLGIKNPMWKGAKVGYAALHEYVAKRYPKPDLCESCHIEPPLDLANKGIYDRNIKNWEWLCRRCHMTKDERMNNLWKGGKPKCKTCGKILSSYAFKLCRKCYGEASKERMASMASYAGIIRWGHITKNKA